jgi:oxygen-independent coproporphyrinogen III oxidase
MKYHIESNDSRQFANIEAALKILDHAAEISDRINSDMHLIVQTSEAFSVKVQSPDLPENENCWEINDTEISDPRYSREDREQRLKELVRLGIINIVGNHLHIKPPWGILSGVRPTKIFHNFRDKGFSVPEIREKLLNIYGLAASKADLLIEIGSKQEKFFKTGRTVSIYLGIPFCPTRCRYCSFSAVPLGTHGHLVKSFIQSLLQEIEVTGNLCREYRLSVESIYIGGGTPTAIDDQAFLAVITSLAQNFKPVSTGIHPFEFTVEAGRPETITAEKLAIMNNFGVTRVSVNPQTMNPETLALIGRNHTISQVVTAVDSVKKYSRLVLNMDLILGLPGEDRTGFQESLSQVLHFEPQNITIHTLAPKRASEWRREFKTLELPEENDLRATSEAAIAEIRFHNLDPYYLYRQRFILADLENIGFAKPGFENYYNIQMMEERQTIFGLGGGAVTKWVVGPDHKVYRHQNPKCPATYGRRLRESIVKKVQQTRLLLG